jgi:hypothetical protein
VCDSFISLTKYILQSKNVNSLFSSGRICNLAPTPEPYHMLIGSSNPPYEAVRKAKYIAYLILNASVMGKL